MGKYIRFIVNTDHKSATKCTGVVGSLLILGEEDKLPDYHQEYAENILKKLNDDMPCPPFDDNNWSDCVCWFKDSAQEWIAVFRDIIAILQDSDMQVRTLTTEKPGMIVFEDDVQVVAKSQKY